MSSLLGREIDASMKKDDDISSLSVVLADDEDDYDDDEDGASSATSAIDNVRRKLRWDVPARKKGKRGRDDDDDSDSDRDSVSSLTSDDVHGRLIRWDVPVRKKRKRDGDSNPAPYELATGKSALILKLKNQLATLLTRGEGSIRAYMLRFVGINFLNRAEEHAFWNDATDLDGKILGYDKYLIVDSDEERRDYMKFLKCALIILKDAVESEEDEVLEALAEVVKEFNKILLR